MEKVVKEMYEMAKVARHRAYAPFSNFKVGVCIRTHSDQFFVGCNVENISYGLSQCGEASAIGSMVSNAGAMTIEEIVVIPCFPCGACRQRILEFATKETIIHVVDDNEKVETVTIQALLPHAFSKAAME